MATILLLRKAKTTHAKANIKVGATFAGAIGVGALMLLIGSMTLGLSILITAGGALGGYLYRARKEVNSKDDLAAPREIKVIEGKTL